MHENSWSNYICLGGMSLSITYGLSIEGTHPSKVPPAIVPLFKLACDVSLINFLYLFAEMDFSLAKQGDIAEMKLLSIPDSIKNIYISEIL